jgi:hypothetical protein
MTSVFGADPEFGYVCRSRPGGRYLVLEHVLLIHRLIWSSRLYWSGPDVGRMCSPEPLSPCLYGEGTRADVRHNWSFCPVHVVVGPVDRHDCILTVLAQRPPRQIVAVACV